MLFMSGEGFLVVSTSQTYFLTNKSPFYWKPVSCCRQMTDPKNDPCLVRKNDDLFEQY